MEDIEMAISRIPDASGGWGSVGGPGGPLRLGGWEWKSGKRERWYRVTSSPSGPTFIEEFQREGSRESEPGPHLNRTLTFGHPSNPTFTSPRLLPQHPPSLMNSQSHPQHTYPTFGLGPHPSRNSPPPHLHPFSPALTSRGPGAALPNTTLAFGHVPPPQFNPSYMMGAPGPQKTMSHGPPHPFNSTLPIPGPQLLNRSMTMGHVPPPHLNPSYAMGAPGPQAMNRTMTLGHIPPPQFNSTMAYPPHPLMNSSMSVGPGHAFGNAAGFHMPLSPIQGGPGMRGEVRGGVGVGAQGFPGRGPQMMEGGSLFNAQPTPPSLFDAYTNEITKAFSHVIQDLPAIIQEKVGSSGGGNNLTLETLNLILDQVLSRTFSEALGAVTGGSVELAIHTDLLETGGAGAGGGGRGRGGRNRDNFCCGGRGGGNEGGRRRPRALDQPPPSCPCMRKRSPSN